VCATSAAAGHFSHLDDVLFSDEIKMVGITIRPVTLCKAQRAAHAVFVGVLRFLQTTYSDFISICSINCFCQVGTGSIEQSPSSEADSFSSNSPQFVKPEGSLPFSQQPTICPCIKPDQSSSRFRTLTL
jgi:hypothetical protein